MLNIKRIIKIKFFYLINIIVGKGRAHKSTNRNSYLDFYNNKKLMCQINWLHPTHGTVLKEECTNSINNFGAGFSYNFLTEIITAS